MAFIDEVRDRFGVEPVCRVLSRHGVQIAPRTYYAAKVRPPSARGRRDAVVLAEIERVHGDPQLGRGLYGVRKVHAPGGRLDGLIQHSDAGSQGGLNWPSQHLDQEVVRCLAVRGRRRLASTGGRFRPRVGQRSRGARIGSGSGRRSLVV